MDDKTLQIGDDKFDVAAALETAKIPLIPRRCSDCQLCCVLLPIKHSEIVKAAGTRCRFQKFGKGCTIYGRRPTPCRIWSCAWVMGLPGTQDLRRPDRSHYIIDPAPDVVRIVDHVTGEPTHHAVLQVWVDPKHPEVKHDKALRDLIAQRNTIGLLRFGIDKATALFPPKMSTTGKWFEVESNVTKGVGLWQ